jgi:DNA-binding PadR family transcriptional regulator
MPRPLGCTGATKMKILAVIYNEEKNNRVSYGYDIWKKLKEQFHIYLTYRDIGNVYHHLTDLCSMKLVQKVEVTSDGKSYYKLTEDGIALKNKYTQYVEMILPERVNDRLFIEVK